MSDPVVTVCHGHLETVSLKKLRIHTLFLLCKETKKLRHSEAQVKKIVKKLRLGLLPYDSATPVSESQD
jgi:hypothetical protein